MTPRIEFTEPDWGALEAHLLDNDLEQGAFCLAEPVAREGGLRLLVREVLPVPRAHLLAQTGAYLETDPLFLAPILKRARLERYSVVIVHSHPFSRGTVAFSSIDDDGERRLVPKIQARAPGLPHAALVVGRGTAAARVYPPAQVSALPARVRVIGWPVRDVAAAPATRAASGEPRYHRQLLAWGPTIQGRLADARIGLVGVGGTGSHVMQQLLHLGVGHLRVIDPDEVDESNLNRLVGATPDDAVASLPKVKVAARMARLLGRAGSLEPVAASVLQREVALGLAELDLVFGCTDDLETRQLLNRMALQYLVPLIDLGVDLEAHTTGQVRAGAGRVTVVLPDGLCLHRAGVLGGSLPRSDPATSKAPSTRPRQSCPSTASRRAWLSRLAWRCWGPSRCPIGPAS